MRLGASFTTLVLSLTMSGCSCGDLSLADAGSDAMPDPTCPMPPPDGDGDRISDDEEGKGAAVDTDGDGTPDWQDADTDGDGVVDAAEAGDASLCTPARDTDGDGTPDFRSDDSDGNSIPDGAEDPGDLDGDGFDNGHDLDDDGDGISDGDEWGPGVPPVDTDVDGTPDFQDLDSDGDGVGDLFEGGLDIDCDGLSSHIDLDADGDAIPDAIEGPAASVPPLDSDGDGSWDFADVDSDGDGLGDADEDLDGDGALDGGESDRLNHDTDADGHTDLAEWAAGSDPASPVDVPDPDDLYVVLPFLAPEQVVEIDFETAIRKADVYFQCDTTGGSGGVQMSLDTSLLTFVAPQIALHVPNVAFGSGEFKDFPVDPFGDPGFPPLFPPDRPFHLMQRITTDVAAVREAILDMSAGGGADGPESAYEALYQVATGEGISWTVALAGSVPKFEPAVGFSATLGHGTKGGAGFRTGALPVVIHQGDWYAHEATDYIAAGIVDAHSKAEAQAAAASLGLRVIGVFTEGIGPFELPIEEMAAATGAIVPPSAWGPTETFCHTGIGGALEPPAATGLCPLVYHTTWGGLEFDDVTVDAIDALVHHSWFDVSAEAVADPGALPALDTGDFVTAVTPLAPAPPGGVIDGGTFRDVQPGPTVRFAVQLRNTLVEPAPAARVLDVKVQVSGDDVTVLDERTIHVIVPGGGPCD